VRVAFLFPFCFLVSKQQQCLVVGTVFLLLRSVLFLDLVGFFFFFFFSSSSCLATLPMTMIV